MDRSRLPIEYLARVSASMIKTYEGDCLVHARAIAALLRDAGRQPQIALIRKIEEHPRGLYHHPLIPLRFPKITWTTHYVCICDGLAYDPILGEPAAIAEYSMRVFGKEFSLTVVEWSSGQVVTQENPTT